MRQLLTSGLVNSVIAPRRAATTGVPQASASMNPNGSAKTTVEQRCCATEHARSLVAPIAPRQPLANAEP
jgi:hypothetical protein